LRTFGGSETKSRVKKTELAKEEIFFFKERKKLLFLTIKFKFFKLYFFF